MPTPQAASAPATPLVPLLMTKLDTPAVHRTAAARSDRVIDDHRAAAAGDVRRRGAPVERVIRNGELTMRGG